MTADGSALEDARRELYAGSRATFVERRKELANAARSHGDRDQAKLIAKLRKPAAAAHVVNLLAQSEDGALQELLELGARIRRAMAKGDDPELRTLLRARSDAIATTLAAAHEVARASGDPVSGAVGDQIAQTLRAAMSSDEAADAVRSGTLTDAFDEPGFEGFAIGTTAKPPTPTRQRRARPKPDDDGDDDDDDAAAARDAAHAAARERLELATAAVARAEKALAAATARRDRIERDRDRLAAQLARRDAELADEQEKVDGAAAARDDAAAELDAAGDGVTSCARHNS
jgi:hypothetical protein